MRTSPLLARWRDEPGWARALLAATLVLFCVLTGWNLARGGDFAFYEASARSMSQSWRALVFGAFDPAATVTLDKLSGFAVPQALSIHLFGMSTSAIALPQVLEGLVTVWACALVGLRWAGRSVGLLAAAASATTPIFVSMFGHPMEDGLLTMSLAVAVLWWQRAVITARWWPLLLAGLFVGLGFQAKMMQAWFVLPALVVGALVAGSGAPSPLPGRARRGRALARAGALAGTAVVTSLAWITAIQLVPAPDRPYVDGSTDNNVFAMVFGYNGVDRFVSGAWPGAVSSSHPGGTHTAHAASFLTTGAGEVGHAAAAITSGGGSGSGFGGGFGGAAASSVVKLIDPTYATQVGWLYPAALTGIVLGLWRWWPTAARRHQPAPTGRAGFAVLVALVVWLFTAVAVLSAAHVPHTAYVAAVGVQLALLAAVGIVEAVRLVRSPRLSRRLVLPALAFVQVVWSGWLAVVGGLPLVLLVPLLAVSVAGLAVGVLAAVRPHGVPVTRMPGRALPVVLAAALLAGPALFSVQVVDPARDGSGGDASVGTRQGADVAKPFTLAAPAVWGGHTSLSATQSALVTRARDAGGGRNGGPLFLTDSWALSAAVMEATGDEVLTDGGYSGQVTVFTATALSDMIASGRNRLFVVKDDAPDSDPVRQTVHDHDCTALQSWAADPSAAGPDAPEGAGPEHPADRSARAGSTTGGSSRAAASGDFTLWSCAPAGPAPAGT